MGHRGGFTIPGESGYEELTLELAKRWDADMIRDSDGTELSPEILNAGYGIYSTVCIIRDHNKWAKANPGFLQQTFLMTPPATADHTSLQINLLDAFFTEQFELNTSPESISYWQVFDRTENREISKENWKYKNGSVFLQNIIPFHTYTVNFLVWRVWEEISMYNHTTNDWGDKEHLIQLDPRYPEVQEYLLHWMENWCEQHPHTDVVRFTSLFYNFVWIWGSSEKNRHLFTDWASYDFTVSPFALKEFEKKYGYRITSEDFINKGKFQVTHMPPSQAKQDWMDFICDFVLQFGKKLVDIVHRYKKKAYVFYDDSWVGLEPYDTRFSSYGFDGLIKCVFSGFEARLCAEAKGIETRELRLHPYLFPTGLGGAPTFAPGGNPTKDAMEYWVRIRRALLRKPVDRLGLGGYLHLTNDFPDFVDCIEKITEEFHFIKTLHENESPQNISARIAVLHTWGKLRSWTLSGHFHETFIHPLIHINEALSGLPANVSFISFKDVLDGALENYDVVINAGSAGNAWSGGDAWKNPELIAKLSEWVYRGGTFIGIDEPTAIDGFDSFFRLAQVLGVDLDIGARVCHGNWQLQKSENPYSVSPRHLKSKEGLFLTDGNAQIIEIIDDHPAFIINSFGKGKGIYLSSFQIGATNTRLLLDIINQNKEFDMIPENPYTEAALFSNKVILFNNSAEIQYTKIPILGNQNIELAAYEMKEFLL